MAWEQGYASLFPYDVEKDYPRTQAFSPQRLSLAVLTRGYCKRQTLGREGLGTRLEKDTSVMQLGFLFW